MTLVWYDFIFFWGQDNYSQKENPLESSLIDFPNSLNMKKTQFTFFGLVKHYIEGPIWDQTTPSSGLLKI